jgi:deoxyribose-phosphate aldolase
MRNSITISKILQINLHNTPLCFTIQPALIHKQSNGDIFTFMQIKIRQMNSKEIYQLLDITSLDDLDNQQAIRKWAEQIYQNFVKSNESLKPASLCLYWPLIKEALPFAQKMGIPIAAVCGNFPSGKASLTQKAFEANCAFQEGATELDLVIDRGLCIATKGRSVFDEVASVREAAPHALIKVILESGQLEKSPTILNIAAEEALRAGAHFLKTSTGKSAIGATPFSVALLSKAIHAFNRSNKTTRGLKVSGGVRTAEDALQFMQIFKEETGNPPQAQNFRIGASALANVLAGMNLSPNKEY